MNETIKTILEKHNIDLEYYFEQTKINLNSAIIEICEEQKKEDAKVYKLPHNQYRILNSKNIAE
jgi:hypothetical protein